MHIHRIGNKIVQVKEALKLLEIACESTAEGAMKFKSSKKVIFGLKIS